VTLNHLSPNWRGNHAAAINPDAIRFGAAPAPVFADCEGCLFLGQRSSVCERASEIAREAGGIDCDDCMPNGRGVIYVACEVDPRQLEIEVVANSGAASSVEQDAAPVKSSKGE
jgi:hypothetical protein